MPTPNKGEKKSDYVSRCIREVMHEGETDTKAAAGKCYGMWEQAKKKARVTLVEGSEEILIP